MGSDNSIRAVPKHVAIVMDGNGRWAEQRGLPRLEGHRSGVKVARKAVEVLMGAGVKHLTLYAFSTENWRRPLTEVMGIFGIVTEIIEQALSYGSQHGVRFQALGKVEGLPPGLRHTVEHAMETTQGFTNMTVNVCLNYGARDELLAAVRRIIEEGTPASVVTEELVGRHLYTAGLPDPDLIIRTGGEQRLSNFLLWQAAYAELYFTEVLWPDFGEDEMKKALDAFSQRQRRFGTVLTSSPEPQNQLDRN